MAIFHSKLFVIARGYAQFYLASELDMMPGMVLGCASTVRYATSPDFLELNMLNQATQNLLHDHKNRDVQTSTSGVVNVNP